MNSIKATDLFSINVYSQNDFPLNIKFNEKANHGYNLSGSGVFQLFFDQQIVYIGLADKEPAIQRFEKQLTSITLRGTSISFNPDCENQINSDSVLKKVFQTAITQNKGANLTSVNRILFAAKNWSIFQNLDNTILERFVFVWFPNENSDNLKAICNEWKTIHKQHLLIRKIIGNLCLAN
jgi:hypothetical protein